MTDSRIKNAAESVTAMFIMSLGQFADIFDDFVKTPYPAMANVMVHFGQLCLCKAPLSKALFLRPKAVCCLFEAFLFHLICGTLFCFHLQSKYNCCNISWGVGGDSAMFC